MTLRDCVIPLETGPFLVATPGPRSEANGKLTLRLRCDFGKKGGPDHNGRSTLAPNTSHPRTPLMPKSFRVVCVCLLGLAIQVSPVLAAGHRGASPFGGGMSAIAGATAAFAAQRAAWERREAA